MSTTARLRAAKLMGGADRKQQAQTSTRRKLLPRPNTERTGANRKRTKERFGTCPNVIQLSLRHSQVSKETAGTGRRPNPNECREEEPIPPSHWQGLAEMCRQGRQRMGKLSTDKSELLPLNSGH